MIPLVIDEKKLEQAEEIAGTEPLMTVKPFLPKKCGIVTTGNEVFYGRIKDTFSPVVADKLKEYGGEILGVTLCGDAPEAITAAIQAYLEQGADFVCCTGGMSVDPDDRTPAAIRATGADIVTYGAPVFPAQCFCFLTGTESPLLAFPVV